MPRHLLPPPSRMGWSRSLCWPRWSDEPTFADRGGSLHSYPYIGKHHPAFDGGNRG